MTANPEVVDRPDRQQIVERTNAMMKLQTSALTQSTGTQGDYDEQELAMRAKLQQFYQDTGLMPAPQTAPEKMSFKEKLKRFGG